MSHIFNIRFSSKVILFWTLLFGWGLLSFASDKDKDKDNELGYSVKDPKLKLPLEKLYSHGHHALYFENLGVKCNDCHNFSIKSDSGPLAPLVNIRALKSNKKTCHECHLGQISIPRRNQCSLCHDDIAVLMPKDHKINWKNRHGVKAQFDGDACKQCHQQNECSACHMRRDNMNPRVHRGNFRYMHSIEARATPASCVSCHQSQSFCNDCHIGKRN